MPLFTFRCKKCDQHFDLFLRLSETADGIICPQCGWKDNEDCAAKVKGVSENDGATCSIDRKT